VRAAFPCGVALFVAALALGIAVSSGPPRGIDLEALALAGTDIPLATFLTRAGTFPVYFVLCLVAIGFGLARRAWLSRVLISVIALIVTWQVSDGFKVFFYRARPEHWFVFHETSAAYPSGHAVLSTTFYGFWAYLAWRSSLPAAARYAIVALATVWILAIGWSRLALGAHFPTDVLGGYLLGGSALCFEIAAYLRISATQGKRRAAAR